VRVLVPFALFAIFLVLSTWMWFDMRARHVRTAGEQHQRDMRVLLLQLQNSLDYASSLEQLGGTGLQRLVSATASDPALVSAHLIDERGIVLASTRVADIGESLVRLDLPISRDIIESDAEAASVHRHTAKGTDNVVGVVAVHLDTGIRRLTEQESGRVIIVRDFSRDRREALGLADAAMRDLSWRILPLILGTALILHWRVTRRLHRVAHAADAFGRGESVKRIEVSGRDEIADLARGLEEMASSRARIEAREGRLARAVEQVSEAIVICDGHGHVSYVNPAFERSLGQGETLSGSSVDEEDHLGELRAPLTNTLNEGKSWVGRLALRRVDGTPFTADTSLAALRSPEGEIVGAIGVLRDVSSQLTLEAQLRQSQKMESVGLLVGGIAHDFNNLLTVIIAATELVRLQGGREVEGHLADITTAAERAASLTAQLLAFSRKQVLRHEAIDIEELCRETGGMLSHIIGEHIQLVMDTDAGLSPIAGDPDQIAQALVNLVINARDAMPAGGRVIVSSRAVTLDKAEADRLQVADGRFVCLSVRDEGTGMDPQTLEKIFDPFFTTKAKGKGTGLGLSTVYGIVKQSKGGIDVESAPNSGSEFRVYLPVAHDDSKMRAHLRSVPIPHVPASKSKTVLLVEDEELLRKMAAAVLAGAGYRVLTARNHSEALKQFHADRTGIDLLLTDVILPGPGGAEIAAELCRRQPSLPVLYMSGYTDGALQIAGVMPEHVKLLRKPFRPETLVDAVAELCPNGANSRAG